MSQVGGAGSEEKKKVVHGVVGGGGRLLGANSLSSYIDEGYDFRVRTGASGE